MYMYIICINDRNGNLKCATDLQLVNTDKYVLTKINIVKDFLSNSQIVFSCIFNIFK